MKEWERVESPTVRLREAMAAAGKKQIDLVQETGLNRGTISRYLSGKYEPKLSAVKKLAKALDVDEMWLWGHDVPKERPANQEKTDMVASIFDQLLRDPSLLEAAKQLIEMDAEKREGFLQMLNLLNKK